MSHQIRCDNCDARTGRDDLTVLVNPSDDPFVSRSESLHFCNYGCLARWATDAALDAAVNRV